MLVKGAPDIHPTKCVRHVQVKKSKVRSRELFDFFVLSARPVLIWRICFIFGSRTTHEVATCLAPSVNHKVKGEGRTSLWILCSALSVVPCLLDRSVPYVAQIQFRSGRCVMYHFQFKVTQIFRYFCDISSIVLRLVDRFASYGAQIQPMMRVPHHFHVKRSKVKDTRVVRI